MKIRLLLLVLLLASCTPAVPQTEDKDGEDEKEAEVSDSAGNKAWYLDIGVGGDRVEGFGTEAVYKEPTVNIDPAVSADFPIDEVKNVSAITDAFGITLYDEDMRTLSEQKFLLKRLTDTSIVPKLLHHEYGREFSGLYNTVAGGDAKERTQANTLMWTADIFLHSYTLLQVELLKEMENTVFAPSMRELTETFYKSAAEKLNEAKIDSDKLKWKKVRNYFAVPYALFSTAAQPPDAAALMGGPNPFATQEEYEKEDRKSDTEENAKAFIDKLGLDGESETAVKEDIHRIFEAGGPDLPSVFKKEYEDYEAEKKIKFSIDFSQFTPRSHYTGSSYRRQYFRAMSWYIHTAFFVESDSLTDYAFAIGQLMAEHPEELKSYSLLESTINFLVGVSDDLMPVDYLNALRETRGKPDQMSEIRAYLLKVKQPKIKSMPAAYPTVGEVDSADVLALTTGMRFFSGKFIMDSYWTSFLTQGDEAPRPGYPAKLPPFASSLEVMALLGSDYAREQIPTLDFFSPENGEAIYMAMDELREEVSLMKDAGWRGNAYTTALYAIRGLFDFERENKTKLPRFMQSGAWPVKTLAAASGFWTELRHAVLLYAKQSFAELGGGDACDTRPVPEPPRGYIEPQPLAYARMEYLAERTLEGLKNLGFDLRNYYPLEAYISMMGEVISYTEKELKNLKLAEEVKKQSYDDPEQPGGKCVWYEITQSDWEVLRKGLIRSLEMTLPIPVEGPSLSAKDKRAAVIADVHTGGDSSHMPHQILYEGTGVPYVILAAVKDINGPRLAIGFTYSQFEFREPLGKRLTDEEWQDRFYEGDDEYEAFRYKDSSLWPPLNSWYAPLFQ